MNNNLPRLTIKIHVGFVRSFLSTKTAATTNMFPIRKGEQHIRDEFML